MQNSKTKEEKYFTSSLSMSRESIDKDTIEAQHQYNFVNRLANLGHKRDALRAIEQIVGPDSFWTERFLMKEDIAIRIFDVAQNEASHYLIAHILCNVFALILAE